MMAKTIKAGLDCMIPSEYKCFSKLNGKIGTGGILTDMCDISIFSGYLDNSAGPWRVAGYASGNTSINKALICNTDIVGKKLSETRLLLACTYKGVSGAGGAIISNGKGATKAGISIISTSGASPVIGSLYVNLVFDDLTNPPLISDSDGTVIADSTDHNIAVYFDGPSKSVFTYVDGRLEKSWISHYTKEITFSSQLALFMETDQGGTSNGNSVKNLHFMEFSADPLNLTEMVEQLHASPNTPCHVRPRYAQQTIYLGCVGQSNEQSTGQTGIRNVNHGKGFPMLNAVGAPNWWPTVTEELGKSGIYAVTKTGAIGGTSIAFNWAGQCKTWSSGMGISRGNYVLANGGLWKSTNTSTIVSTVSPTGTTSYTTSDGIPWTYVGIPTDEDINRHVYAYDSTRFDPNGFVAAVKAFADKSGNAKSCVWVSIGQTDVVCSTSRSEYAAGIEAVCRYLAPHVDNIVVGYTISAGATYDIYADSTIIPGLQDALEAMADLTNVHAGVNLRDKLGTLTESATENTLGLWDSMHANLYTLRKCGVEVAKSIAGIL